MYLATGPFGGMCAAQPLVACASGKSLSKRHSAFPVGEYVAIVVRLDNVFGLSLIHIYGMRADDLVVAATYVDEGPTLKRIRPRAKGSASRILKRTSHITVIVAPRKEA